MERYQEYLKEKEKRLNQEKSSKKPVFKVTAQSGTSLPVAKARIPSPVLPRREAGAEASSTKADKNKSRPVSSILSETSRQRGSLRHSSSASTSTGTATVKVGKENAGENSISSSKQSGPKEHRRDLRKKLQSTRPLPGVPAVPAASSAAPPPGMGAPILGKIETIH